MSPNASALQEFRAGEILIRENELSRKMYVIRKGKVRVFKTYMGQKIIIGTFGEGEVFGEMSFIDAQPRSASVEATTNGEAYVLDGGDAEKQLTGMPEWILGVLKTVFHRLREMDNKLVVYQSMNEFERRHYGSDKISATIFQELLRFNKIVEMIFQRLGDQAVTESKFYTQLKDLAGDCRIGLDLYWKLLKRFDFIDEAQLNRTGSLKFNKKSFGDFQKYLEKEHQTGSYRFMSHSGLGLLRKIVTWAHETESAKKEKEVINVPFTELRWNSMPFFDEAVTDLQNYKLVLYSDDKMLQLRSDMAFKVFVYQSMLRAFDNLNVAMD